MTFARLPMRFPDRRGRRRPGFDPRQTPGTRPRYGGPDIGNARSRIMFSLRVKEVMERRKFVKAPSTITVGKAARLMAKKRVGALLVVDGARLQGIFTERDVLFRVVAA